jgi:hypothetical protein
MRGLVLVAIFAGSPIPAFAAHRIAVAQLHSLLVEQKETSKTDERAARQIGSLELTERLSLYRLSQFRAEFRPGPKTVLALTLLGDLSAFLDPPADQLPSLSPPDFATQKAMLGAAVKGVTGNIQRLPDFLAMRTTRSFDDSPLLSIELGSVPSRRELRLVNAIEQEITFRNAGEELGDAMPAPGSNEKRAPFPKGLSSWGEFGILQAIILADSAKGELKWSHWERGALGVEAVFDFSVPQIASHYLLDYCCIRSNSGPDLDHPYIRRDKANSYKGNPAYHGTLSVDPATGTILRITLQAELKKSDPITRYNISVQFGALEIGGKSYICPVQSVALSLTRVGSETSLSEWDVLRINDVSFTNYHRFGSTITVLPGLSEPQ